MLYNFAHNICYYYIKHITKLKYIGNNTFPPPKSQHHNIKKKKNRNKLHAQPMLCDKRSTRC